MGKWFSALCRAAMDDICALRVEGLEISQDFLNVIRGAHVLEAAVQVQIDAYTCR